MDKLVGHWCHNLAASLALMPLVARGTYDKSWRGSLRERFGGGNWTAVCEEPDKFSLWLHGASVGELGGIQPIVKRLRDSCADYGVLVTTTSLTGREEVLRRGLCDLPCLLPFDHPVFVNKILGKYRPKLFLFFETELWPGLLYGLAWRKTPIILANGRISQFAFPRYRAFRWYIKPALQNINKLFIQTEHDAERFVALGADEGRIEVIGSSKYDERPVAMSSAGLENYAASLGLDTRKPCLVAGSVRPNEVNVVLEAYSRAREKIGELQLVLAPRHPEKFEATAQLLSSKGFDFNRRSDGSAKESKEVLLLDTLGELKSVYSLASLSFVGATLVNIGGHNPLEPAAYRCPVILGPFTSNVCDAVSALRERGGLIEVQNADEFADCLIELLSSETKRRAYGDIAYNVWKANLGASERIVEEVCNALELSVKKQVTVAN